MPTFERILLGIDPGYTRIGFGFIRERSGKFEPLKWGVIECSGDDLSAGKREAATQLGILVRTFKPECAAVERLFFASNKRSAMAVSEMRGVLMLVLAQHSVPVSELTPLQVKQRICGHGQADKKQMQRMVGLLLNIKNRIEPDDAADALGLALCAATERTY